MILQKTIFFSYDSSSKNSQKFFNKTKQIIVLGLNSIENVPSRRDIFDMFEEFGKIEHLIRPWKTDEVGRRYFCGFCFIGFKHSDEAKRAVRNFRGKNSDGKQIEVKLSEKSTQQIKPDHWVDDLYDERKAELKLEDYKIDFKRCSDSILTNLKKFVDRLLASRGLNRRREEF
jgi:RNA recognition motif-containing protein